MSKLSKEIANLSTKQRAVLELRLKEDNREGSRPRIERRSGRNAFSPLSFAQQRLFFLNRLEPDSSAYNVPSAIRVTGPLDVRSLAQAFNEICVRHESLRTTFSLQDGEPVQSVASSGSLAIPVVDLSELSRDQGERETARLALAESQYVFDLERGPLVRVTLLRLSEQGLSEQEHVAVVVMHHIISDVWSIEVLTREIIELYRAFSAGLPSPLDELSIQYADFARWQRQMLSGEMLQEQLAYWKKQLTGGSRPLDLPADRIRPPIQTSRGASLSFRIPNSIYEPLRAMSRQEGVSFFMTLLAAFQTLLYRYSGQDDISVGTPVAGRNRLEVEGLIGFFVNTLVMRTDLSGDPSFRDLLHRVREVCLEAYAHQEVPFEKLVEELRPERELSRSPLFQVMFTFQSVPSQATKVPGLTFTHFEIEKESSAFDLILSLLDNNQELMGVLSYNADLFFDATIKRMSAAFEVMLQSIANDPTKRLSDLPLLTEQERRQLLVEWNDTFADYPKDKCIHQLIQEQVELKPDAVACVFGDTELTYRELNARANQTAHYLKSLGVKPDTRVGICVDRSLEFMQGLLGILKAGGAYVPLDSALPKERLAFMLNNAEVSVLITNGQVIEALPEHDARLVRLDADLEVISRHSPENPPDEATMDNLAYVMYTSGSTGRPKGVMIPHRGVYNTVMWRMSASLLLETDIVLQNFPVFFDPSVWQLFGTFQAGARLILAKPGGHQDADYVSNLIAEQRVTNTGFNPSMLQILLHEPGLEGCDSLRYVECGGEILSTEIVDRFNSRFDTLLGNEYGPTEATILATYWPCNLKSNQRVIPIGRPITNTQVYLLDSQYRPVPVGVPGELYIGGELLARGYLNRPGMSAERFTPNPFSNSPGGRLYKTGDLARYLSDGNIEFIGRTDHQVKIRGYRIELGEIEAALSRHPEVEECVVVARESREGDKRLVAYIKSDERGPSVSALRAFLKEKLPDYSVPAAFVRVEAMPLGPSGKLDIKALPAPDAVRPDLETDYVAPRTEIERVITAIWQSVLEIERPGIHDNFFDLGGHSLLLLRVQDRLRTAFHKEPSIVDLFEYPTISSLAGHMAGSQTQRAGGQEGRVLSERRKALADRSSSNVAIVGMSGRFPGAGNLDEFWQNLQAGVESISFFSEQELALAGVPADVLAQPNYVRARGMLGDVDLFDASFFGFSAREAEMMDPQHRIFLECALQALENAGHSPEQYDGRIGVYAGMGFSTYLFNLFTNREFMKLVDFFQVSMGNDKDFLSTRVSYKLNLKGPSMAVQTACSTSLVAVHLAFQSLLNGECDMALAGGVTINAQQKLGYLYQEGGISSPDGHCRAFDAKARGTLNGDGVGIVCLKRFEDALTDGDHIYAIIKGSAINNDGAVKVGYTAPSVNGQAEVIAAAHAMAGVDAETITYVEAHGTGTALGDPIEIAALTQVFRGSTDKKGFCAIGSVKTNIGHVDAAAGVAGLIKAALALQHKMLPPSLHYEVPNPRIDFANSPFYVNSTLADWTEQRTPRRAGVSSFGIGGTNVHIVIEEAPEAVPSGPSRPWQLLTLSAKTGTALEAASFELLEHLKRHRNINLADVAYTLQTGRAGFRYRRTVVCSEVNDAIDALEVMDSTRVFTAEPDDTSRRIVFMFPGQGAQQVNMGMELYESEPVFREQIDACTDLLKPHLDVDLHRLLCLETDPSEESKQLLNQTYITQPALFAIEYALAKLYESWGIRPDAMIGHSLGEYVAACLAGVFKLDDALMLVAARGRLMQQTAPGQMLAVGLGQNELAPLLSKRLSIAAINGPALSTASGPVEDIIALEEELAAKGVHARRLHTSHAFHSETLDPVLSALKREFGKIELHEPAIDFISNVTGKWITGEEAMDPEYWARQMRQTVRFADGIEVLKNSPASIFLEVGPGQTLSALARQQAGQDDAPEVICAALRHALDSGSQHQHLMITLGRLWLAGVQVDWKGFHRQESRKRIPLPTYPFERERYWIETSNLVESPNALRKSTSRRNQLDEWFYIPSWKRSVVTKPAALERLESERACWVVFVDNEGLGSRLIKQLAEKQQDVVAVLAGDDFATIGDGVYSLNPSRRDQYSTLLNELARLKKSPSRYMHLWNVTSNGEPSVGLDNLEDRLDRSFYSLIYLVQALGEGSLNKPVEIAVITNDMQRVAGERRLCPEKAMILGPCKVISQEYQNLNCISIDIVMPEPGSQREKKLVDWLLAETASRSSEDVIAYRDNDRWVRALEPIKLDQTYDGAMRLRDRGVYLITGGLGGIGLEIAHYLAQTARARLVLVGRSPMPERSEWAELLTRTDQYRINRKIRKLQAIEESGAELLIISADVTDQQQMQRVKERTLENFGGLHGIIHMAGIGAGGLIQLKSPETAAPVLAPKVQGTIVLDSTFKNMELDFFLLSSSLSTLVGGLGQVDYCSANAFLDGYAQFRTHKDGTPTVSINWSTWREVGMAVDTIIPPDMKEAWDESVKDDIRNHEGVAAFSRILHTLLPQVAVSTRDLGVLIEQSNISMSADLLNKLSENTSNKPKHKRPKLRSAYQAPRNDAERVIADIWQRLLGIEQVGVHDSFLELGGHSVLAIQLTYRLQEAFGVEVPAHIVFENQTIAELGLVIEERLIKQLGEISEEEADRLTREES